MKTAIQTNLASVIGAMAVAAVCAAERTWTGGGGDANWSTAANWEGTVPSSGDALNFSGSARLANTNDLPEGTSFAGVSFASGAGAFALAGNSLTLGGDVTNWSSNAQTLALPLVLDDVRTLCASNGALAVTAALSGAGGLTKTGAKTLTLTSSNSYDGVTTVSNGLLAITHSSALGSTAGGTVVRSASGGYLQIGGGIVVDEPLTLNSQRPNSGTSLYISSGSNTLNGAITRISEFRLGLASAATLVVKGGVYTATASGDMILNTGGGKLIFTRTPLDLKTGNFWSDQSGTMVLDVVSNTWAITAIGGGGMLRTDKPNALPSTSTLEIGLSYSAGGTVNLNGNDQTVAQFFNGSSSGTHTLTSPTSATLTVNQSSSTLYGGLLTGKVGLYKQGAGTLTLSNALSTTTGDMTVSNGTLVVATAAGLGGSTNIAVLGGTLELRAAQSLSDEAVVSIADGGAKVEIGSGVIETVGTLFVNGVQQTSGTWGATGSGATHLDDDHFGGTGCLNVQNGPSVTAVTATWDAGGSDTRLSTAANWENDALPAFDGATLAVFGTAGSTATVDTAVGLYGLVFDRDGTFTLAGGGGTLSLGAGGIAAVPPSTTAPAYTLAQDLTLVANQAWCVSNNGSAMATLTVSGSIGDAGSLYGIAKYGSGTLVLSGSNSYHGVTSLKTNGAVRITNAHALGSPEGATVVEDRGGWVEVSGGLTVPEPLALNGDQGTGYAGALRSTGGSNVWSGAIAHTNSRIRCTSGSLDIVGGLTGNSMVLGADGSAFIRVAEKPVNIASGTFYAHTSALLILAVTNNVWGNMEISGNRVRTDVAGALPASGAVTLGSSTFCGLNLNGNDQTIGKLVSISATPGTRIVFSAQPATLTVDQSAASVFNGSITGAVTVVKSGAGNLVFSGTNTTYGGVVVSNGTLTVSETGTLGTLCTNVVVAGGTLSLSNALSIARTASLDIANGGGARVSPAAGVVAQVGRLYLGGQQKRVGTYGAAGSGAAVIDDEHFAGEGVVLVLRDDFGTVVRVW